MRPGSASTARTQGGFAPSGPSLATCWGATPEPRVKPRPNRHPAPRPVLSDHASSLVVIIAGALQRFGCRPVAVTRRQPSTLTDGPQGGVRGVGRRVGRTATTADREPKARVPAAKG